MGAISIEKLPKICFRCGWIVHGLDGCSLGGGGVEKNDPSLLQYGEWLRAEGVHAVNSQLCLQVIASQVGKVIRRKWELGWKDQQKVLIKQVSSRMGRRNSQCQQREQGVSAVARFQA